MFSNQQLHQAQKLRIMLPHLLVLLQSSCIPLIMYLSVVIIYPHTMIGMPHTPRLRLGVCYPRDESCCYEI